MEEDPEEEEEQGNENVSISEENQEIIQQLDKEKKAGKKKKSKKKGKGEEAGGEEAAKKPKKEKKKKQPKQKKEESEEEAKPLYPGKRSISPEKGSADSVVSGISRNPASGIGKCHYQLYGQENRQKGFLRRGLPDLLPESVRKRNERNRNGYVRKIGEYSSYSPVDAGI